MHGEGVIRDTNGAEYRGQFRDGVRQGLGMQQFGNKSGRPFECALSGRHCGKAFCEYTGQWSQGWFHGIGIFQCCDGRSYSGQWWRNQRHGKGLQKFVRLDEAYDPLQKDRMYRPCEYEGEWVQGRRTGHGTLRYLNGDEIEGEFLDGFLEGLAVYRFKGGAHGSQYAMYERGHRLRWAGDSPVHAIGLVKSLKDLILSRDSRRHEQMLDDPDEPDPMGEEDEGEYDEEDLDDDVAKSKGGAFPDDVSDLDSRSWY